MSWASLKQGYSGTLTKEAGYIGGYMNQAAYRAGGRQMSGKYTYTDEKRRKKFRRFIYYHLRFPPV